jgi:cyclophilin family peptidyl-prolyl cis-trans isomerase
MKMRRIVPQLPLATTIVFALTRCTAFIDVGRTVTLFTSRCTQLKANTRHEEHEANVPLEDNLHAAECSTRRTVLALPSVMAVQAWTHSPQSADAAFFSRQTSKRDSMNNEPNDQQGKEEFGTSIDFPQTRFNSVEDCLLELLPARNKVFLKLVHYIGDIIPSSSEGKNTFRVIAAKSRTALEYLDNYRTNLEPAFDLDDENTMLQILRNERFEQLLEALRKNLESIIQHANVQLLAELYPLIKASKILLAELGELLVSDFPYEVPREDSFSTLPRLEGRARVTFTLSKKKSDIPLGNVTIIADGFAAPLAAGQFVDLSMRNFYNGLPVKAVKKNWGAKVLDDTNANTIAERLGNAVDKLEKAAEQFDAIIEQNLLKKDIIDESATSSVTPILGSFQNGFIDPLTAKPRKVPLEYVKIDKTARSTNSLPLRYTVSGMPLSREQEALQRYATPLLTFNIPGLVALNHPDGKENAGNSEFFSLPLRDITKERVEEMNGRYAPFGYVVEGLEMMQHLDPSIEISATYVDTFGRQNLVKVRDISFANVMQ